MTINLFTCPVAATNKLNDSRRWSGERSLQNKLLVERKIAFVLHTHSSCMDMDMNELASSNSIFINVHSNWNCTFNKACCCTAHTQIDKNEMECVGLWVLFLVLAVCVYVCVIWDGRSQYVLVYRFYIPSTYCLASGISLLLCFRGNCRTCTRVKSQIDRVSSYCSTDTWETYKWKMKRKSRAKRKRSHIQKKIHFETLGNSVDDNAVLANDWRQQRRCRRRSRSRRRRRCLPYRIIDSP